MKKFDGILLCTDFDNTLAYHKQISAENAEAIRYFQANGGRFTVISGRQPEFLEEHLKDCPANAPLVGYNGAQIKDHQSGEVLYEGGRNDCKALELLEPFWRQGEQIKKIIAFDNSGFESCQMRELTRQSPFTIEELKELISFPLYKVVCSVDSEQYSTMLRDALSASFGDLFEISRSCPTYMEISCIDACKGVAARRLKEMLGAKLLVTAGDYENDVSMLKAADIGYAVGNASPEVKAAADRVTVSVEQHAIAAIIKELEQELS